MDTSLLQQGIDLMTFGMGTVFVFLTLLVICVRLMSKIIGTYFVEPETITARQMAPSQSIAKGANVVDPQTLLVIQDAIYQHRARKHS